MPKHSQEEQLMFAWEREDGATMVEYAFMVGFVAMVAFLAVGLFGGAVRSLFQAAADLMP